ERVGVDRRATTRDESFEQSPALQGRDPEGVNHVGRDGVARERRTIDDEHLVALAREQHRGRRARAARTDDDHVEVGPGHDALPGAIAVTTLVTETAA